MSRLPLLLLLLTLSVTAVAAAHPALRALEWQRAAVEQLQQRLKAIAQQASVQPAAAAVSTLAATTDPTQMFEGCGGGLETSMSMDPNKLLLEAGVSAACSAQLNTSTPTAIQNAQNTLDGTKTKTPTADCLLPEPTGTRIVTTCTITVSYPQTAKQTFKDTVEHSTPAGRMVAQDMSYSFQMSISFAMNGVSASMYVSQANTTKGEITALPAACTNADLGKFSDAFAAFGLKLNAALQTFGTCLSTGMQAFGGTASASAGGSVSMTLYPEFDSSMQPVQSIKVSGSYTKNGALPTAAGSMFVATLLALAAAAAAANKLL